MTTISACLKHAGNGLIFSLQSLSALHCAWTRHSSCWHILFQLLLWQIVSAIVQLKCCRSLLITDFRLFFEDRFKSESKQSSVNHRQLRERDKKAQGGSQSSWIYRLCQVPQQCSAQQLLPEHVRKECFLLWGRIWLLKQSPTSTAYQWNALFESWPMYFMNTPVFHPPLTASDRDQISCFDRRGENNATIMVTTVLWNIKGNHMPTLNSLIFFLCLRKV